MMVTLGSLGFCWSVLQEQGCALPDLALLLLVSDHGILVHSPQTQPGCRSSIDHHGQSCIYGESNI